MSTVASVVVIGLTLGCFASLRAVGFAVVYDILGEADLAFGDGVVLSVLVAVGVHARTGSLALAAGVGIGLSALLMLLTDLLVLRPLRGRGDALAPIMATIGAALILRNIATSTQGVIDRGVPPFAGSATRQVAGTSVDSALAVAAVLLLIAGVTAGVALTRSDRGRAVRAVRSDPLAARVSGIRVGRVITLLYGLGGAVGGLAGLVYATHVGDISVSDGFRFTLVAFAAAAFGGGRSIGWALAGGMVLGMVSAVVQYRYGQVWTQAAVLGVLIALLLARPRGLARLPAGERAG